MIEKVIDSINKNSMFQYNDKVIVAVSGGPDSICLLNALNSIKDKYKLTLFAAHVNHCLRGKEADEDEEYVKNFCKRINVDFYSKRVDINKLAEEKNISTETCGREVRYEFFSELKVKLGAQKVAIAHNANDQAETILMRIIRGTGIEGLIGIKPVRDDVFVRPLINITRREIEEYCEENCLNPRIDKTNLESIYTRNKIRLELIPYIEKNFNKEVISVLNRLSELVDKDNDYLENISWHKYEKYCDIKNEKVIIYKDAFKEHVSILSRIIRLAVGSLSGTLNNFERIHIYDIIEIQKHITGKRINLPNGLMAVNNYGDIHLYINKQNPESKYKEHILCIDKENLISESSISVTLRVINDCKGTDVKKGGFVKYFDLDKISGDISLRYRKAGDKFTPLGMKGSKKLKDLFIDLKIPKDERDRIPLICFGNDIAWIVGYRISDIYKVEKDSKNILEIKVEGEEP